MMLVPHAAARLGGGLPNTAALPLYYVYDSYQTPTHEWQRLLQPSGDLTVRNTPLDGVFIGLLVTPQHVEELVHVRAGARAPSGHATVRTARADAACRPRCARWSASR